MNPAADRLAVALNPGDRIGAGGGKHVEMDVAVTEVAERQRLRPGQSASMRGTASPTNSGICSTATEMSCCIAGPLARSAGAINSRSSQNTSAWDSFAAMVAVLDQALLEGGGDHRLARRTQRRRA